MFQRFLQFIVTLIVLWVAFDVYVITIITLFIKTILPRRRSEEGSKDLSCVLNIYCAGSDVFTSIQLSIFVSAELDQ